MKFLFNLLVFVILAQPLLSKEYESNYLIKTKGIKIGELSWKLEINNTKYETRLKLINKGFFSNLYSFRGEYSSVGQKIERLFISKEYSQSWKTKKKFRDIHIFFENKKIKKIKILPKETEKARINLELLSSYNDPITSFLNVLFNKEKAFTVDGRRIYLLTPKITGNFIRVTIDKFENIWANHKRNDLEYIEIINDKHLILPKKINIKFKGSVFSLIKM